MLTRNHRQEALSRAYVRAIAARCGLVCGSSREYDYGVDTTLHEIHRRGRNYADTGFHLDLQLKSTVETGVGITGEGISYDLAMKAYDDLRDSAVGRYRILVLVVLPADESLWTTQTEEHLLIRRCAYWLSLRSRPSIPNQRTFRVTIPRINVFSVDGVRALFARMRKGESL